MPCAAIRIIEIDEVFGDFFPPECHHRLLLMLRGFLDGSVSGKPQVLSVAGFIGNVDGWKRFQKAWRKVRANSGIDYFHMTDFMSRQAKPYVAWSEKRRHAVISRLLDLINKHTLFGVGVAMSLDDFNAEIRPIDPSYKPYRVCSALCVGLVAKTLQKAGITEPVMYVFEAGDEGEPAFRASMARIVEASQRFRDEQQILGLTPGTKRQYPALDAADFFAWQVGQQCRE